MITLDPMLAGGQFAEVADLDSYPRRGKWEK
jgi:hypothetical protein